MPNQWNIPAQMFFLLWSLLFKFQDIKSYLHDYFSICDSKCFYIAMWTYGASPPVSSQLDRPLQIWLNSVWLLQRWCLFTQKPINIIQTSSKPNRSLSCAYIQTKNLNTSICKCLLQLRNDFKRSLSWELIQQLHSRELTWHIHTYPTFHWKSRRIIIHSNIPV